MMAAAKAEAVGIPDFVAGVKSFALARSMMSAVELGLIPALADKSLSRPALCERLGLAPSPITDAFLDILRTGGALAEDQDGLRLGPLLEAARPAYDSIESWNVEMLVFYQSLVDLTARLKTGDHTRSALARFWAYKSTARCDALEGELTEEYSRVMDASQAQLSGFIAKAHDWSRYRDVVDFGGGLGRLAIELARTYPTVSLTVADLPAVCAQARQHIASEGFGGRVGCRPLDFLKDDLSPASADAVILSRVLHDWQDAEALKLLGKARSCLRPQGRVVIVEPIADPQAAADLSSSISSLMLVLMGGRRRGVEDHQAMLAATGLILETARDLGLSSYKILTARLE